MNKIEKAHKIIKEYVKENYEKHSWIYQDYYIDNRFLEEIENDDGICIDDCSEAEIAEYAKDKIQDAHFNAKAIMRQFI